MIKKGPQWIFSKTTDPKNLKPGGIDSAPQGLSNGTTHGRAMAFSFFGIFFVPFFCAVIFEKFYKNAMVVDGEKYALQDWSYSFLG